MSIVPPVWIAVLAVVSAAAADPKPLVQQLGSTEPAARAEAAHALEALGRDALPALEEAARGSGADLRGRASAVWETIQRGLATRASLVRLNARNRALADVLGDLQAQTGMTMRSSGTPPRDERVTLQLPDPVPFWTAVERLGLNRISFHNERVGKFPTLDLQSAPAPAFTSIDGPFRVSLIGLHLHRDHRLVRGPWVRTDRFGQRINARTDELEGEVTTYYGGIEVMTEPRVWFTQEAPARLTEATDDLGQSLVPEPSDRGSARINGMHFAFTAGSGVARSRTYFRLRATDRPGHTARLRGVVPLMLHLRRPNPALVIPLADAAGKTFRCDDAEFTIRSVKHLPRATNLAMTMRLNVDRADLPENPDRELIGSRQLVLHEHQLELVDANGTVIGSTSGSGSGDGTSPVVYRSTFNTVPNGQVAEMRYYSLVRIRVDAAFDFRDVPLP
jgi:hypothetical protein